MIDIHEEILKQMDYFTEIALANEEPLDLDELIDTFAALGLMIVRCPGDLNAVSLAYLSELAVQANPVPDTPEGL